MTERIWKRIAAAVLAVVMLVLQVQVPAFGDVEYANSLDGWMVQAAWSYVSLDYGWNAKEPSERQPKMVVTYRIDHAGKAYPAGSLQFTVPGIGRAVRGLIGKAYELAADQGDSEWSYVWDQESDVYTFTNRFEVEEGQSVSGGFELLWKLEARDCVHDYSSKKSPTFSVDGAGTIVMEPLSYHFISERDRYRIYLEKDKLYETDYENADQNYIWYQFRTRFDKDWRARGLYRSDYDLTVELPETADYGDVVIIHNGKEQGLTRREDGSWGVFLFQGRSGDIGTWRLTEYDDFTIGFKKATLKDEEVTLRTHLARLYQDETEWEHQAGESEIVDCLQAFRVEDYHFEHTGYLYDHDLWNLEYENYNKDPYYYWHGNQDERTHEAPMLYSERMNAVNLYNGKLVQFTLRGQASRSYASAAVPAALRSRSKAMAASPSDASQATVPNAPRTTISNAPQVIVSDVPQATISDAPRATISNAGRATPSDGARRASGPDGDAEPIPEDAEDWEDICWREHGRGREDASLDGMTYEELHSGGIDHDGIFGWLKELFSRVPVRDPFCLRAYAATRSNAEALQAVQPRASGIGQDQEYALILGDDALALFTNGGDIRRLEDEEYSIAYVTVPADGKGYDYEVYGASSQDTSFEAFTCLGGGNTREKQIIPLPDGVKSVFLRVNGITGSYTCYAYVGVRLHLDWAAEQEKEYGDRPDHENRLVNFSYLRSLYIEEDEEVNDCAVDEEHYAGTYGEVLARWDEETYGEQLCRDYSNVWLRSPVTNLKAEAMITEFQGGGRDGFTAAVSAVGIISADNSGGLSRFSVYSELPEGLQVDLDEARVELVGSAKDLSGSLVTDFASFGTIERREVNGKTVLAADFDCSDAPLQISETTRVMMSYPVTLSYADFVTFGSHYAVSAYVMVHDDGIDKVSGEAIRSDIYDLDGDGVTEERMAYHTESQRVDDTAEEWREFVSKYVSGAYTEQYEKETVARLYQESDSDSEKAKSDYTYRLDFGLGSNHARNIVFFDRIEQGAVIRTEQGGAGAEQEIPSAWQGQFRSVDTAYVRKLGLIPTIYYSTDPAQELDLGAGGWSDTEPSDPGKVRAIAVSLDTSALRDGVLQPKQMAYVLVHMRAPEDVAQVGKKAVNQYTVQYDAYGLTNGFEQTYTLTSSETYVRLLDTVGTVVLQKVDGDHLLRTEADGARHYAALTGARFQVYDSSGTALFEEPKELNSLGHIVVRNVPYGTYYWEEVEAPEGYRRITGRHPLAIDGVTEVVAISNQRIPGEVTLTKLDEATQEPLEGAVFELYDAGGHPVLTDPDYRYDTGGTNSTFVTGGDGTLQVTGLPWGSYSVRETEAPQGYEADTGVIWFSVGKEQYDPDTDTVHAEVTVYNEQRTAAITLAKTDEENGKPIAGAVYSLYREKQGEESEDVKLASGLRTNAAGEITVSGLKFGTYYFVETRNAGGYQMPDEGQAVTEKVLLDAATAGQELLVSHTNQRKTGSVVMTKTDDAGQLVGGAEYALYYRGEGETEDTLWGIYCTEEDKTGGACGELCVEGLLWGDYYFAETKAPQGYVVSEDRIAFTVDQETVQNTIYIEATNQRWKGSIRLVKVDRADPAKTLAGAEYALYRTDGTLCAAGVDYKLPEGREKIVTGADGSVVVSELVQGAYYLQETTAPIGYSISDERIRFSVTRENSGVVQQLVAADEIGKATVTINKRVNTVYEAFGNPTFVFRAAGSGGTVYTKTITLDAEHLEGSVSFAADQGQVYTITELPTARYVLKTVIPGTNATLSEDGTGAVVDLTAHTEADVTFVNEISQFEKFSHTSNAANLVKETTRLTAVGVEYCGPDPVTPDLSGYDADEEVYVIPKSDLRVTAYYDDGTQAVLADEEYQIAPESADGSSNSYTGTVSYTEAGITRTGSFSFQLALPKPKPRYTVTFDLNGGMIIPDGGTSAQDTYSYKQKAGTSITKPEHDPVRDGYSFLGWFTDAAFTTEAVFPQIAAADQVFYAKWQQDAVKVKYAVCIYGIMEDTDAKENTLGLTFGPAAGASYVNAGKGHVPSEGQLCIHGMEWSGVIAQSRTDPTVFRECLERGCTHAVELELDGALAEGAASFPDMAGDGAGVLAWSLNPAYRQWSQDGTGQGGWQASSVRDTLSALAECFPQELAAAIVPKAVQFDPSFVDSSQCPVTVYDKLWLFSQKELWGEGSGSRPHEGHLYTKQEDLEGIGFASENVVLYNERQEAAGYWTRSLSQTAADRVSCIGSDGRITDCESDAVTPGLAPGFCLPGPKETVRYAVSIYGVKGDSYSEDSGTTIKTAGLTFGPATGSSYVKTYQSHTPDGVTAGGGNPHRCLHQDTWDTVIYWSERDPYVYEQCMGAADTPSCTKSVPLYLNSRLAKESYTMKGDGTGVLYNAINNDYMKWNGEYSAYFAEGSYQYRQGTTQGGWPDAMIRNTLNGVVTDNMLYITNKDNGFEERKLDAHTAVIGCFPASLKAAIVPKAVQSDTVPGDYEGNSVTTYDKLWLFSRKELQGSDAPGQNEGNFCQRAQRLGVTGLPLSQFVPHEEYGSARPFWLRSQTTDDRVVWTVQTQGYLLGSLVSSKSGISPGFVIR